MVVKEPCDVYVGSFLKIKFKKNCLTNYHLSVIAVTAIYRPISTFDSTNNKQPMNYDAELAAQL